MQRRIGLMATVLAVGLLASPAFATVTVNVAQSAGAGANPWLGFVNVSELPSNGGAFVFGSPWGVPDLVADFDDGNSKLTLEPNQINDPDPFWYQGGGAPGNPGNKVVEANLYIELTDDALAGEDFFFEGNVLSNTFTAAHESYIFIKDFAPDYSTVIETKIPITPGPFSVNATLDPGLGRHIQYGFQVIGENVWSTDIGPFGNAMIATVPEPASLALLAIGSLFVSRRRK